MTPDIKIMIIPGSPFCTKVLTALHYKRLPHTLVPMHPTKLKSLPAPHQVPVMSYNDTLIPDSHAILKYIDERHHTSTLPLYPAVTKGATDHWKTVHQLELFAHDTLTNLYYYWGGVSAHGRKHITQPFIRMLLPKPVTTILPFLPAVAARAARGQLRRRIEPVLGKMDDAKAREQLWEALQMLEAAFKYEGQLFLFDTDQPTAADFSVFAALKRLADPVSEMRAGIAAGYPSIWEWELGRLKTFYEGMNERFYVGRVKYSKL